MNARSEIRAIPTAAERTAAFAALANYDRGAGRGALQPIDDAVAAATQDSALRAELESHLVAVLRSPASAVAKEYACGKLALLGGPDAVPALAGLLSDPDLSHPAANALRAIPGEAAARALRQSLASLAGPARLGVIAALGHRRDTASVGRLAGLLSPAETSVAAPAAAALGQIGTARAARALQNFLPNAPATVKPVLAEACLVCAQHLSATGEGPAARRLLNALLATTPPPHVRAAALQLLSTARP